MSVPFSRVLSNELLKSKGKQSYHPLLAEDVKGRAVRMVNVDKATVRKSKKGAYKFAESLALNFPVSIRTREATQQSNLYAQQILTELVRIRKSICETSGATTGWSEHVAVLVPGSPRIVLQDLLAAVVAGIAKTPANFQDVKDALPSVASLAGGYGPTGLFFGAVENFAGLEREFVIAAGMQHPEYLIHRKDVEGWEEREVADPRMYIAVTRCTLELSVVEVEVEMYAAHFQISSVASGGSKNRVAPFVGKALYADQLSHAVVEKRPTDSDGLRYVRVGVDVDLTNPPTEDELETAAVLIFQEKTKITQEVCFSQELWDQTTFKWSHCKEGVFELTLRNCFCNIVDCCLLLEDMLNPDDLPHLAKLRLSKNQLTAIPESLGNLVALTFLDLFNNQLMAVPESLGNLAALTELNLFTNQLTAVPDSLGNLHALRVLNLGKNQLTTLPESVGNLVALTALGLSENLLTTIPDSIGNLVALTSLRLRSNQLTGIPGSVGKLVALSVLVLDNNQLTTIPIELGQLQALTHLHLHQNQLTTIPSELGRLQALTELKLHQNELRIIPSELGQLSALAEVAVDDHVAIECRATVQQWEVQGATVHNGARPSERSNISCSQNA
jgi:hypothetical protein